MPTQLPLPLRLPDYATLENFYPGQNVPVIAYLTEILHGKGEFCSYLYGTHGVGLTHLLQSCCRALSREGKKVAYLPLGDTEYLAPEILEGMEQMDLVCLDDIEAVAGQAAWEEGLFHLYNRAQAQNALLLVASHAAPTQLPWKLPDLASRLAASTTFHVHPLTDDQKITALQQRAKARGLELPLEVGRYLLNHCPRNLHTLFQTLEQLDQASLSAQRRLTIPFISKVLGLGTTSHGSSE